MLLDERDPQGWVLKALREAGNSLLVELYRVDEDLLCRRPKDGDWCLKEIAAHMRDAEELALRQMSAILEGSSEPLPVWDIDGLPQEHDYVAADVAVFLDELRSLRRQTTQLLWGLSGADWRCAGRHPYRGELSLGEVARELAQHDLEHLWQVRRLKHELGMPVAAAEEDWG